MEDRFSRLGDHCRYPNRALAKMPKLPALHRLVMDNARCAFEEAVEKISPLKLFGFCLYSDDGATTLVHTVGIQDQDSPAPCDEEYWNPHEWEEFGGLLDDASQALLNPSNDWLLEHYRTERPSDDEYHEFRNNVFDTIVEALADLRSEGVFGKNDDQIYVCFSVSQWTETDVLPWVEALNSVSTVDGYKRTFEIGQ